MTRSSVQETLRKRKFEAGICKGSVSIHALRHLYAITFSEAGVNPTIQQSLRCFISTNQRAAWAPMFRASSETLRRPPSDEEFIGDDLPGWFGVLHTPACALDLPLHIHYIAAGGAFSCAKGT